MHRIRVEHMERQLANLTGLVQKALTQNVPTPGNINQNYLGVPGQYRGKFFFIITLIFHDFYRNNFHTIINEMERRALKQSKTKQTNRLK